jgi:hypothetical protein
MAMRVGGTSFHLLSRSDVYPGCVHFHQGTTFFFLKLRFKPQSTCYLYSAPSCLDLRRPHTIVTVASTGCIPMHKVAEMFCIRNNEGSEILQSTLS